MSFEILNPTRLLVFITFFVCLIVRHRHKNKAFELVFIIVSISAANEILTAALSYRHHATYVLNNLYVMVHGWMWFRVMRHLVLRWRKLQLSVSIALLVFGIGNFFIGEGMQHFAFFNFIVGSILYVATFLYVAFGALLEDDFLFFKRREFLLLLAPIPYYLPMSMVFGFGSKELHSMIVFGHITFYMALITFVNCLYYGLILLYTHLDNKYRHNT